MRGVLIGLFLILVSFGTAQAVEKQVGPREVVMTYLLAMNDGNMSANLPIYSKATQKMLARHPSNNPTAGKQLFNAYVLCPIDRVQDLNGFAVVRYHLSHRKCAPFFLIYEDNAWKLDMTMMQRAVRFNQINEWRFNLAEPNPYMFAFSDWVFDRTGAPETIRTKK